MHACPRSARSAVSPRVTGRRVGLYLLAALAVLVLPRTLLAQDFQLEFAEIVGRLAPAGTGETVYMDIWGYTAPDGTELVLLAAYDALFFVDVRVPESPEVVYQWFAPPSTHRDMRTWGTYAYSVNETSSGMQVFDLSDPLAPQWVATYDSTFSRAHNIGIYDGYAYIAGSRQGNTNAGMRILDLSDPTRPVEVGAYADFYVHDVYVRDDMAFVSNINNARVTILDVSDKSNPLPVATIPVGNAAHQSWLTEDGRYLLTAQENLGGHLRIWDLQDPQNPVQVATWNTTYPNGEANDATIHNVFVRGDTAYASWYNEGLQVIDITDITQPRRVAQMDTRPTLTTGFTGMWGVYPFAANGLVYCSDMMLGLFVVRLTTEGPQSQFLVQAPDPVEVQGDGPLLVFFDVYNGGPFDEDFTVELSNSQGWSMSHAATLWVPRNATELLAVTVTVPAGTPAGTVLNLELCLTSTQTGTRRCAGTDPTTPILLEALQASRTPRGGVRLSWRVQRQAPDALELTVLRRDADAVWRRLVSLDWRQQHWLDDSARSDRDYDYALAQWQGGEWQFLTRVHVAALPPGMSRLLGNVPNPFNPQTSIHFELSRPGRVEVRIHDVRGRLVRLLHQHVGTPGAGAILWDGRDTRRQPLPSGVYPYVIRSGRWQDRGTMTLVR